MRKICKRVLICFMLCTAIWGIMLLKDRDILNQELIRFHVIANSDSKSDQTVKLQVRDAVLSSISEDMLLKDGMPQRLRLRQSLMQKTVLNVLLHFFRRCRESIFSSPE